MQLSEVTTALTTGFWEKILDLITGGVNLYSIILLIHVNSRTLRS